MDKAPTTERWRIGERLLATFVSAVFVFAPLPGFSQQGASEGAESTSDSAESSADEGEATPEGEKATGGDGDKSAASDSEGAKAEAGDAEKGASKKKSSDKPTPKVSMLPTQSVQDQITEIVPQRIGEMLRERMASEGRVDLLPSFADVHKQEETASASAAIKRAREQYRSGIGLANAGKFEPAAEKLGKAVETFRANMADLGEFDVYTDALLKLAWSYWEINHNYDARKKIGEYAHLRPDAKLDRKKYPKKLLEIYDSEVEKVEKAGTGKLVIASDTEGATVVIDGEKKGKTPVTVTDVGFGYHYLVVQSSEGGVWTQRLRVRARGKKQEYDVKLGSGGEAKASAEPSAEGSNEEGSQEASDAQKASKSDGAEESELPAFYTELTAAIADGNFGTDLQPYLEELASRTGVGFVTWVVMIREGQSYVAAPFVYRVEDGMFVQGENVSFNVQLSNLRVGVRDLKESIIEIIRTMPEERAVTSVALGADKSETSAEKTASAAQTGQEQQTGSASSGEAAADPSVEPPPSPAPVDEDDDSNKTLTYLGIAGAAVLVGGLTAGGIYFLGDGKNQSKPKGFSATVTW